MRDVTSKGPTGGQDRERLLSRAMRLEACLYQLHDMFWFRPDGAGGFSAVACVGSPDLMCTVAGVGLGLLDPSCLDAGAESLSVVSSAPERVVCRPRDGLAAVVHDDSESYYDKIAGRKRTYVRVASFALCLAVVLYYILSDILRPAMEAGT